MEFLLSEANEILKKGYPSSEELSKFPFGTYLQKLPEMDVRYPEHGPKVLEAMNMLLSSQPEQIISGPCDRSQVMRLQSTILIIKNNIFEDWDETAEALFRLAALYHDIGKFIIKERHPTVGWYILEYLAPVQRADLAKLIVDGAGKWGKQYLQTLLIMIRDHDRLGTLSTGEASYPILLQSADAAGYDPKEQMRVISALMMCNLPDMAGIFKLDGATIDKVIDDWEWFRAAIDDHPSKGKSLDKYVIDKASEEKFVIRRICRLLTEASRNWPERHSELDDEGLIRHALNTVFPTAGTKSEFCRQFTRVCKLDYGKRFFEVLVEYCEALPEHDKRKTLPLPQKKQESKEDTDVLVYAVLAILKRIVSSYAPMVRSDSEICNLIGVEMKDLTPDGVPGKSARIIELILGDHYPGLAWLISDLPAWYF